MKAEDSILSDQRDKQLADLAAITVALTRHLELTGHQHPDVIELTPTEVLVTRYLEFRPDSTASSLAHNLKLQPSNLSAVLKALERKGVIIRERSTEDARQFKLILTDRARQSIYEIRNTWSKEFREDDLGDSAIATTLATLSKMLAKYESF